MRTTPAVRPHPVCTIDITRGSDSANVKPGIPNAKNNKLFCIKAGTTVVWMSSNKNNGFMVSFGTDSPFEPDEPDQGRRQEASDDKSSHSRLLQIRCGCVPFWDSLWNEWRQQAGTSHSAMTC